MSDKYTLIAAEYAANIAAPPADAPTLTKMCLWIGVSKSGYYEWKDRPLSATAERQEYLKGKIKVRYSKHLTEAHLGRSVTSQGISRHAACGN